MKFTQGLTVSEFLINLTVLLILAGILLAVLFPAVQSGPRYPSKAEAKNDVCQIATAVNAFVTEYGVLPGTNRGNVGGEFLAILMGANTNLNSRGLVFLEVNPAKRGRSGVTNGTFVDPWGGPYQIAFDNSYRGIITNVGTNGTNLVNKTVAVWSDPNRDPDAASLSDAKKQKRYVNSWE